MLTELEYQRSLYGVVLDYGAGFKKNFLLFYVRIFLLNLTFVSQELTSLRTELEEENRNLPVQYQRNLPMQQSLPDMYKATR